MPKYGFLIDNRKCIGCHACTVACKQEHEVPLGRFRTWVKYVEQGAFPETRRHFSVMRCNHCERPPCVAICPVTALYKRDDGIVDFDPEVCIGCKACMQACPYDALFIEPSGGAANKCNFCAHRIESRREPPCVTVCPEQAIVMGDLEDPESLIRRLIEAHPVTVRAPEKATRPQLYYIDGTPASLDPLAAPERQEYLWSQSTASSVPLAYTEEELQVLARRTYDIGHERPWGWKVGAYLWTKSIASGAFLVPILLWMAGAWQVHDAVRGAWMALVFLGITNVLLVADLKRPWKFLSILLRPQRKSWLVKGAYVLIGYGAVLSAFVVTPFSEARMLLLALGLPLSMMTAAYTAWLFEQCEARDLWHSRWLAPHLVLQAVIAGSACLGVGALLGAALLLEMLVFLPLELRGHTRAGKQAAAIITRGALSMFFWMGVVCLGHLLPLLLLASGFSLMAAVFALGGLLLWEHLYVVAGQAVPLS
ncbi:MAG: 4Fe-4S dicluster domain-containing protein [Armatimonadetes bacterium]|nr:4Fe-4S dicluster domain-containing protein [Armatimonadota bacterium]